MLNKSRYAVNDQWKNLYGDVPNPIGNQFISMWL